MSEKYLTIYDVAKRLNVTTSTVYNMIRSGKLKEENQPKGNRIVRCVKEKDLEKFMKF